MAKANRLKSQAEAYVPQTLDDCAADIRRIGDLQRQITVAQAEMNDAIAEITERYQPVLQAINEQIKPLQAGVQTWCDANRHDLTRGGKVKSASFVTGEVQWRQRGFGGACLSKDLTQLAWELESRGLREDVTIAALDRNESDRGSK